MTVSITPHILTFIVFLPLAGAAIIALFVRREHNVRYAAATVGLINLLLSLWAWVSFDTAVEGVQHVVRSGWIAALGAEYFLGVDGLSLPLVVLTTLIGLAAVYSSWHITTRVREYFVLLLVLQTGVLGVFTSLDFLLFFLFWELELVPMYLLITIWGTGRPQYSAMKFLIFTLSGGALMLIGLLVLYFANGTFDIPRLIELGQAGDLKSGLLSMQGLYLLLFMGFAIKLAIVPLHTWLPDAHTDAPTAVSVMLAGVLLKMGGYGLIRFNVGIFPDVTRDAAGLLAALAAVSVIYGALVTLRQTDLKRLVAFSSVSHMGLVLLGIASLTPLGLAGASLQMFTHGTITGLLFLLVGLVYEKAHTRHIPDLGGLAPRMPFIAVIFVVAGLASLGLPGTSGFVAEITVFLGSFGPQGLATAVAAFGVVLAAGYILWTLERVFFGPAQSRFTDVTDAAAVDTIPMVLLTAAILIIGLYPAIIMEPLRLAVGQLLGSV